MIFTYIIMLLMLNLEDSLLEATKQRSFISVINGCKFLTYRTKGFSLLAHPYFSWHTLRKEYKTKTEKEKKWQNLMTNIRKAHLPLILQPLVLWSSLLFPGVRQGSLSGDLRQWKQRDTFTLITYFSTERSVWSYLMGQLSW